MYPCIKCGANDWDLESVEEGKKIKGICKTPKCGHKILFVNKNYKPKLRPKHIEYFEKGPCPHCNGVMMIKGSDSKKFFAFYRCIKCHSVFFSDKFLRTGYLLTGNEEIKFSFEGKQSPIEEVRNPEN